LDKSSLEETAKKIVETWSAIDILINCAGGNVPGATLNPDQTIFDMKIDDWEKVINLNQNGTVFPCLVFGKVMAEQTKGSIINISSMATYSALTRIPGYSVAKTGINIFTKWMATELAQKFGEGIRVNAIAPGFFIGDQNRSVLINPDGSLTERSKKVIAKTPMGRFGDITELNGVVQFLCSEAAGFITGAIIPVDGGFSSFSGV
jgi:NAD(P)-dependent dehydrogenase (short-subunit alcohol dehydrogenase family)